MVRGLFLLLVLGNLVFYVWAAGYLGAGDTGREPERLQRQLEPGRLQVALAPAGGAPAAAAAAGCRLVEPLPVAAAEGLKAALEGREGVAVQLVPKALTSYWVAIPSLGSKAAAERKATELRQLGVTDFFVVNDPGPNLHAISLGLFHTEESAEELLQKLARKGVRSARIETRPRPADQAQVAIRGAPAFLDGELPAVLASFSATAAPCPAE